jgi:hypothetical protein
MYHNAPFGRSEQPDTEIVEARNGRVDIYEVNTLRALVDMRLKRCYRG